MYLKIPTLLVIFIAFTSIFAQKSNHVYIHPYSNAIGLSLEGGITQSQTDFNSNEYDYLGRGLIEYFFYSNNVGTFGLRIYGGLSYIAGKDGVNSSNPIYSKLNKLKTDIYHIGGGYSFTLSLTSVVHPYIFAGLTYIKFYPRGDNNIRISSISEHEFKNDDINYDGEFGVRFLVHDNFSFNISGLIHYNPSDNLDGVWANGDDDIFYSGSLGISYYFNDSRDSDADGIDDSDDFCINTPPHIKVDEFGCPLDEDNDGVPDQIDLCPDTPLSVVVDTSGCPVDIDEDGVSDDIDECLYTPKGIEVDSTGCPSDFDKDGVPNYLDNCPHTPIGYFVDSLGCPAIIYDSTFNKVIINNFDFAEEKLPTYAEIILEEVISYMNENPVFNWSIEGHSDSISVDCNNNYQLSVERATAVYNFLVENGIEKKKLNSMGFSHFRPVAENNSERGRRLNRRVEIIKLR